MKNNRMHCLITAITLAAFISCGAKAEPTVFYNVSFPNAVHHEARFSVTFHGVTAGKPLVIRMSRSSPGYYALFAFSKNVYNETAFDSGGIELPVTRPDQHQWVIGTHDGTVKFDYTLFADYLDGTHSSVTEDRVLLNIPSACVWADGFDAAPVFLKVKKPDSTWKVITQLKPADSGEDTFTAPDLARFMDSPVAAGPFSVTAREIGPPDARQTFKLALNHRGTGAEADKFCGDLAQALEKERAVFGEYPRFEYGTYTLIAAMTPIAVFDGMEHRDSSVLTSPDQLKSGYLDNLRMAVHEMFHAWDGERLRPKSLEPFDLTRENMSGELWFMEGAAVYYEALTVVRSGACSALEFGGMLAGSANYAYTYPGPALYSLADMSLRAVLFNGGAYLDPDNRDNFYVSYYPQGCIAVLALDLSLRARHGELSLDRFMKTLWEKYGKTETPYTNEDLRETLAAFTQDRPFADDFFARFIYGRELPDLAVLLQEAGFVFRKRSPDRASPGRDWIFEYDNGNALVARQTLSNEPYYGAGIDKGDVILNIGSRAIHSRKDLLASCSKFKPGQTVTVQVRKAEGRTVSADITLEADKTLEIVPYEQAGMKLAEDTAAFRKKWLEF